MNETQTEMKQIAKPVYSRIAQLVVAMQNCEEANNTEWYSRHEATIETIVKDYLPSGSGFDNGTKFDVDASNERKLVFNAPYHHMDENGYYNGWTDHTITVRPSLWNEFELSISGKDRNDFKSYAHDVFRDSLQQQIAA